MFLSSSLEAFTFKVLLVTFLETDKDLETELLLRLKEEVVVLLAATAAEAPALLVTICILVIILFFLSISFFSFSEIETNEKRDEKKTSVPLKKNEKKCANVIAFRLNCCSLSGSSHRK